MTTDDEAKSRLKQGGEEVKAVRVAFDQVEKSGESFVLKTQPEVRLESRAFKMSKSRGNVVNPDVVVREYGADSLRLYEMFMGPLEATKPWSMEGVNGVRGFLDRAWRMIVNDRSETLEFNADVQNVEPTAEQNRVLHKTIHGVTQDFERMAFNTSISKLMEFTNYFFKCDVRPRSAMEKFVLLLAPLAPHLAEELWQLLGHDKSLAYEPWPKFDAEAVREDIGRDPGTDQRQATGAGQRADRRRPDGHGASRQRRSADCGAAGRQDDRQMRRRAWPHG